MTRKKSLEIADLFCGAGGTSTGAIEAMEALGYDPRLTAINHWDVAIATHTENHPKARHLCTSLDNINPRDLYKDTDLDLLWASPECTHHSVARGGKPINDQSRATAWCVVRWAEALLPNIILVENVPEFQGWGPLTRKRVPITKLVPAMGFREWRKKHKKSRNAWRREVEMVEKDVTQLVWIPDPKRKGEIYQAWKSTLEAIGYKVDDRVLCAADYGDPTTRKRLFIQCVRGRKKICWPEPTHSKVQTEDFFGTRKPWVTAKEIIDWTEEGQSIFERKRPLSPKTMKRIWAGLEKFGLKPFIVPQNGSNGPRSTDEPAPTLTTTSRGVGIAEPYIITMEHGGSIRSAERPLPTITTAKGGAFGVVKPYLVELRGTSDEQVKNSAKGVDQPLGTVTAGGGHHGVCSPYLVHTAHGGERKPNSIDEPTPTIAGNRGDLALLEPSLLPQQSGGAMRPVSEPAPTVSTAGAISLIEPYLIEYYGNGGANSVDDPLKTVTCKERHALVKPVITINGEKYILDIRFRMLMPKELAAAQGFRSDYQFTGNKTEQVKQIGNAVPRRLARAICLAVKGQTCDIGPLLSEKEAA